MVDRSQEKHMLRNIHFFNLKPGVDEDTAIAALDRDVAEYTQSLGCIERKTWKLLDAHPDGSAPAMYMNEALWSSQRAADSFGSSIEQDTSPLSLRVRAAFDCITVVQNLRFVDDEG